MEFSLTNRQAKAVSALISYDTQEEAAAAMDMSFGGFRNLLTRARNQAGVATNEQLVYHWTIFKIKHSITEHV